MCADDSAVKQHRQEISVSRQRALQPAVCNFQGPLKWFTRIRSERGGGLICVGGNEREDQTSRWDGRERDGCYQKMSPPPEKTSLVHLSDKIVEEAVV